MTPLPPPPSQPPLSPRPTSDPNRDPNPPTKPVMRIVVPLQGIVQGRGGLILGSIIPCALFYFYQLYLKKNRNNSRQRPPPPSPPILSPTSSDLASELHRSSSRANLASSSCGSHSQARVSARASSMVSSSDSTYYLGLTKADEDPYHALDNPNGIIQLGLAENRLSLDLIEKWFARNLEHSLTDGNEMGINGITTYQPFDGLMDLKVFFAGIVSVHETYELSTLH